jgi:hypothetical protein
VEATFPWQLVHVAALAFTFPACGSWQVMHPVLSSWLTLMVAWHPTQEAAAAPGSWCAWQLVQTACAGTVAARSVAFAPWQSMHTLAPATKACGLWQSVHES